MKVLLVNKFLYPRAGAETVFLNTKEALLNRGHEVSEFGMEDPANPPSAYSHLHTRARSYDTTGLRRIRDGVASVYSLDARRRLGLVVSAFKPDVVHLHNIYHQLTLALVDELADRGVASVLTLHDFKIGCPAYTMFRDGRSCHLCVGSSPIHVVRHRCVKDSLGASLLAYAEAQLARTRGAYRKLDRIIAPSQFAADVAIQAGANASSVRVIPNFLTDHDFNLNSASTQRANEPTFVFAGRLDPVKGVLELCKTFAENEQLGKLTIAGDGPQASEIAQITATSSNITFLGRVDREVVHTLYASSWGALIPSIWEENCPMSLLEARAAGAPIVCSASGGLPELVTHGVDGYLVPTGDREAWCRAVRSLHNARRRDELAAAGRQRLEACHSEQAHLGGLLRIYDEAQRQPHRALTSH